MKIRNIFLYAVPLLLVAGIAYGNFIGGSEPSYVLDAMDSVSNKMSYDHGLTKCKSVQSDNGKWSISCRSSNTPVALIFSVLPPEKAPHDVATPFYLIADNDVAKKSSREGLLSFLMIDINQEADQVKQLTTN
ncbi:hypothetical protein AB6880_02080 [Rahnella inusitata]|uniref:hypothetical protein n=1 Tax=Rahnella inusitata TaxID=58169 RepID=UPI0039BE736A